MTYLECEELYTFYKEEEAEKIDVFFKLFAFHNLESSIVASRGDEDMLQNYLDQIRGVNLVEVNDIEKQFQEVNFV